MQGRACNCAPLARNEALKRCIPRTEACGRRSEVVLLAHGSIPTSNVARRGRAAPPRGDVQSMNRPSG